MELVIHSSRRNAEVVRMVENQEVDVGLVGGPVNGEHLMRRALWAGELGVLLPADHLPAHMTKVPTLALKKEPLVLIAPAPGLTVRSMAEEACARAGFTPHSIIEVTDALTVFVLVNAGAGIGFASTGAQGTAAHSLLLRPLAEDYIVETSIIWRAGTETPALQNVLAATEDLSPDSLSEL